MVQKFESRPVRNGLESPVEALLQYRVSEKQDLDSKLSKTFLGGI